MMKNVRTFKKMKQEKEKIVMLTAYDYPSAKYAQAGDVDMILVGDSLGMVVLGYEDTLQVTLEDIIYHTKAVRRGAPDTFIAADMPFMSFHLSLEETKENAALLIVEGGANAVKLEGGKPSRLDAIAAIVDCEIPVIAHLGLTPQSINSLGGYVIQGKKQIDYQRILEQASQVEEAGAFMLVLEGIPEKLGKDISESLFIPTIGIGAGRFTDGQVMIYHDLLSMSDIQPKFVKSYANLKDEIVQNIKKYSSEIKKKKFPEEKHIFKPITE